MVARRYDFDGTQRALVPLSSPWGIGTLAYADGALTTPALKPNGTRFGGWLLNSADNLFRATGDFDGDGRAEILVSSPWGMGVLEKSGSTFACPALAANGWELDMAGFDESSGVAVSNTKKPLHYQGFYGLLRAISAAKNNSYPRRREPWRGARVGPLLFAW